jgi:hypothetical protein
MARYRHFFHPKLMFFGCNTTLRFISILKR